MKSRDRQRARAAGRWPARSRRRAPAGGNTVASRRGGADIADQRAAVLDLRAADLARRELEAVKQRRQRAPRQLGPGGERADARSDSFVGDAAQVLEALMSSTSCGACRPSRRAPLWQDKHRCRRQKSSRLPRRGCQRLVQSRGSEIGGHHRRSSCRALRQGAQSPLRPRRRRHAQLLRRARPPARACSSPARHRGRTSAGSRRADRHSRRRPASSPRRGRPALRGISWSLDRCSGIMVSPPRWIRTTFGAPSPPPSTPGGPKRP